MDNFVIVHIRTENGCDPKDGEYSTFLVSMLTALEINSEPSDVSLIEECIAEAIHEGKHLLPEDGLIEVRLRESGERQDVFFLKYFVVEDWEVIQVNKDDA